MNLYESIEETQLWRSVLPRLRDLAEKTGLNPRKIDFTTLNEKDKYLNDVFQITVRIADTYQQLIHIAVYSNHFPKTNTYTKNNIDRSEYIQYHLENHLIRVSTIHDQFLILFNEVCCLGLSHKQCKYETVIKKIKKYDMDLARSLISLNNATNNIIERRHMIVHRGYFHDKSLHVLGALELLNRTDGTPELTEGLNWQAKHTTKKVVKIMKDNNKALGNYIIKSFNQIGTEFESIYTSKIM